MEVDRVVCAVATALRNLAIDQRNKELIGKKIYYASHLNITMYAIVSLLVNNKLELSCK